MIRLFILFCLSVNLYSQTNFPNATVRSMDNKTISLHNLTAEVSFVSFWATWCLPCVKEIDKLNEFIHEYSNISVILINEDRPGDKAKVKGFIRSKKYPIDDNYHVVFDTNSKLSRQFNAQPIPLTLIVKNNKVIYRKRGFYLGDEVELKKQLDKALND
ncbi:MAG: TlpA family protein disulfide reductase [Candidatus Marinimicrobia bacterium]|jgi:thiol:disulfide interchange protein DsbD|nr:TlpA family protein disulfide reductase [Gammaproteobacteria bacterium]MBT3728289.1 TlpA family protein disulfide reductase [Candidatus Neomarinimicrobiota bacterium]MBT3944324.1 TlpA family protein disulfide reductase [Candidatus Neomarinimicrobiota bacterium]MBT4112295.1 TlpA family protein disulfide reductase [Candidatus Neomarinimicrobiota bacterium]MBT4926205.1 TlpA family protein disulfide reductase [Candidatus Neomarinimicrobiota bacterium]